MQISYLADHPQFIEVLAPLVFEHWRPVLKQETLDDRIAKFKAHLNRDTLPVALVAHSGAEVFGTAALRLHDLPGREDLTPWLGGVYVAPEFRRQGIGATLCKAIEQKFASLSENKTLYLFTLDKQAWYRKLGWSMFEPCTFHGHTGDIMHKRIVSQ